MPAIAADHQTQSRPTTRESARTTAARTLSHRHTAPRGSELPTCTVCADSMVAAEASAFVAEGVVSYLWTCDTCGYGFVTRYDTKAN